MFRGMPFDVASTTGSEVGDRRRSSIDFAKSSRAEAIPPTTASEGDKPAADGRRSGLRRGPGLGSKGDEVLLRPLQGLTFLVPEMGRGDLPVEQLEHPPGGLH